MQLLTSLRVKLVLVFVGLILIAISGIAFYGYFFTRSALSEQALERSSHQVHLQAESIVSALQQAESDVLYLSVLRSLDMLRKLRRENASDDQIALWQNEAAQDFLMFSSVRPMYNALRYLDAQGLEVVAVESDGRSVSINNTPTDLSHSNYFLNTMALQPGAVYVSAFAQNQGKDEAARPFLHYALKLPEGDGLVLIDLHAGWLLRNLPANPGQDIWALVDQDGNYLVYPEQFDPARAGTDVKPMLSGQRGTFETAEDVFVFDAVHPAGSDTDQFWVIYRQTPKMTLYSAVTDFYRITTVVIIGAILLTSLLALLAGKKILAPLLQLERQAAAFGHGGPAPALPPRLPRDEIGTLTRTFCEMSQELERKRNQEHRLIEQLIDAQEEERKLLAYDLHDGLIQQLVGARFYLTNCRQNCPLGEEEGCESVKQTRNTLTDAIIEGRRIVEGLRPAVLDDLGLAAAIEEVAQSTAKISNWELELDIQLLPIEPDKTVGVTLFRIAQEALNNVRKHAQARRVKFIMHNGDGVDLTIEDDGAGFDMASLNRDGHGLGITTMQERAALVHGKCEITSAPHKGTRIHVWMPLTPNMSLPVEKTEEVVH
jgi:signal transduction histidine kinase